MSRAPVARAPAGAAVATEVMAFEDGILSPRSDAVTAEEPLEIRAVVEVGGRRVRHAVAVTMRTPGHDFELAAGFFWGEGIVRRTGDVAAIAHCDGAEGTPERNVVEVTLGPGVPFDPERFRRNVYTTSSCGVCGKASIDLVRGRCDTRPLGRRPWTAERLIGLPALLRAAQPVFSRTGGIHAAGLFDTAGRLLLEREDVGRHNAVDKVVGGLLSAGRLPASDRLLLVSGRASFELVQKAIAAGIPALAAVGAPSSLAVDLAREFGLTLVGFLRGGRFNVYSGGERIAVGTAGS